MKLETLRLFMREFNRDDAREMDLLNSDPDVIKFTGDIPFKNINEAKDLIKNYSQYKKFNMGKMSVFSEIKQ